MTAGLGPGLGGRGGLGGSGGWRRVVTLAAVAWLLGVAPVAGQEVGLPLGERAQPVVIEDLDGNPVDLAQWVGKKPVLLEFWATWCPLCAALEPRIEAVKAKHGDALEVLIVAVAVNQSKRTIERHMSRHPAPGRVLWDTSGRATRAFMAPSTSYIVMLDRQGRVVYTGVGEDQDLEEAAARAVG